MAAESAPAAAAPAPRRGFGVWTMLVALVIVAVLAIYAFAYTVPAGSVAIVKTFGEVEAGFAAEPGLHLKWPAPIQSVQVIDQRPRLLEIRNVELTMNGQFNVHVVTTVGWRVADPHKYVAALTNEAQMQDYLRAIVQDARSVTAMGVSLESLVTTSPEQRANYTAFTDRYLKTLRDNLDPNYGVEITMLAVHGLALPETATNTIQETMAASRRAIAEKYKQEGESQAAKIKARAETDAARLIADAEAEARRIEGESEAEALQHYDVYTGNPDAARLASIIKNLDALEKLPPNAILLWPSDEGPFSVLNPEPGK